MDLRTFYILNLAVFTGNLGMGIVIPFLPIYAKTLGATGLTIGIFFASFPLAQILFMPTIGRLSDRHGRKGFIALGLFFCSLLSLWYLYAPNILYLILGRFVQGGVIALIIPIATAYVGDLAPPEKRGTYMGVFNLFLTSSFGVGPLVGGWLSDVYGMEASFYWMGGLNLIAFLAVLAFLPEARPVLHARAQTASYRELLRRPKIQALVFYRMINSIQMGLWFSFLPLLATEVLTMSKSHIGVVLATYMLVNSLVQVPFGRLADRISRQTLIAAGGYLGSLAFAAVWGAQGFLHLLFVGALAGATSAMAMPALTAMAADEGHHGGMGAIMGVLNMAMSAGMMLGPVLAGGLAEVTGLRALFLFSGAVGVLGTAAFGWLTMEQHAAALPTPEFVEKQTQVGS
ncbi:MAG TPA: MFS transporter [Methylomirabilota bacterium]|nr:MFS transporter [Methylomirabilota bacterium]